MAEQLPDTYYRTPFKFNGKELDEETGLYYYGARYYDPKISIWLSVDPLVEAFPNWNPYNYTMQNPINLVDPTGMSAEPPTDIYKVWKNNDGTYRADKWQHIADGKNDQIYLMMGDNGVATAMYQGAAAQNDMYSDGIKLDHIDYRNGSTVDNVIKASKDFWTSDEYRTKAARETMLSYTSAVIPVEGLLLGMLGTATKGLSGLLKAGNVLEKGGLTAVGRALQKHGSRTGSIFPKATGNAAAINVQGETVLKGILTNPNATNAIRHHARFGKVLEYRIPGGQGARFSGDGKSFIGFLE